jgi:uncharacterized glyoxalase superfamily protein PhnB
MSMNRIIPSLLSKDMTKTIAFYELFGFQLSGWYPSKETPEWIELYCNDVVFRFYSDPPRGISKEPEFNGTLYIMCDDVQTLAKRISGNVTFEWGPEVMEYGQYEFGVKDPNGYFIAFAQVC